MSRFGVVVLPDAEADLRAAFGWYFDRSPIAANAFRAEIIMAIDRLAQTAADWPRDEDGTYRYHLKHFPYTVMYEIAGIEATVLAVAHQRRRPGYWKQP